MSIDGSSYYYIGCHSLLSAIAFSIFNIMMRHGDTSTSGLAQFVNSDLTTIQVDEHFLYEQPNQGEFRRRRQTLLGSFLRPFRMDASTSTSLLLVVYCCLICGRWTSFAFAPGTHVMGWPCTTTTATTQRLCLTQLYVASRLPEASLDHANLNESFIKVKSVLDDSIAITTNMVKQRVRRKYTRKRTIPETERRLFEAKERWEADYERIMKSAVVEGERCPSIWSFESLFPEPVLDEASIRRDLFGVRDRDAKTTMERSNKGKEFSPADAKISASQSPQTVAGSDQPSSAKMMSTLYGGSSMRSWRERRLGSADLSDGSLTTDDNSRSKKDYNPGSLRRVNQLQQPQRRLSNITSALDPIFAAATAALDFTTTKTRNNATATKVDRDLTRMVEYSIYGYKRTRDGGYQYETSLIGDGAVQFRDGVRLGKPLRVNADRLTYLAKKELQHGRVEEAQEMYEQALVIDPQDGRAYLGLSRCAERRRDFTLAREFLRAGIARSYTVVDVDGIEDRGGNPFLMQALGCLEEKMGHLSEAEALYISATKSRPWHAAAWVALAQLRTRKLGQSAEAGRALFQAAERELKRAGQKQSSHVYTAWASLEYHKAGDVRRARELYNAAIEIDRKCSAAHLQLGAMESDNGNWEAAQKCFDAVLKFDPRNSRVLQAYAIMESKRPGGNSRTAISLFERARKANPRDGGALQGYALHVASQGDLESARELLSYATEVDKRHAAAWQAWGVLEMNQGNPEQARIIFQQGIWACAQLGGCQSGGYRCARLWQAWGLLEAQEGDHSAARRCFSRALDADSRNVATVTAWVSMEEGLRNIADARAILERALKQFAPGSEAKSGLWRFYELMEKRHDNMEAAQRVYQRSMGETLQKSDEETADSGSVSETSDSKSRSRVGMETPVLSPSSSSSEVEIVRWGDSLLSLRGEVWMNERAGKAPPTGVQKNKKMNRKR